jgi:hypothetical protein
MIGGRMKVVAQGASEPESFAVVFHLKIQKLDNDLIDGDFIA